MGKASGLKVNQLPIRRFPITCIAKANGPLTGCFLSYLPRSEKKHLAHMIADLKTVTGLLDAGKVLAVRYVKASGEITELLVSKRRPSGSRPTNASKNKASPHMKSRALIPVRDHTNQGQFKNLLLWGIIGFNPTGEMKDWYSIRREA